MESYQSITGSILGLSQEPPPPTILNLNRQVFNKTAFNSTIDTLFSELGVEENDPSFFDVNLASIDDCFTLYEKFFFEFEKFGINKSHEYLIIESSNYINFEQDQEEINELLLEIEELRAENLKLLENNTSSSIELATIQS